MTKNFDVIIVGMGPSGLVLAGLLTSYGIKVGIFEKNKSTVPLQNEQQSENERPKFGISSLINRMSRSESLDTGSELRKEPNFNSTDEVENQQDKMEVPAFLRRQAN